MSDIFDESKTFHSLGLRDSVVKGLETAGFKHPTAIQAALIPAMLSGKDLIGQAKTGTGKTAAFGLPVLNMCDKDTPMQALILTPTRELAVQVSGEIAGLGKFTPIKTSCIIGGESMRQQIKSVQTGGHIIVGTPGRIMDMHQRRAIHFDNIKFAVLDEVDRMLDIGFRDDIKKILKTCNVDRQTVFVSATMGDEIERLSRSFMKDDAEKISTTAGALTVSLVEQLYLPVEPWDKRALLLHMLRHEEPDTTLVFCRTKATVRNIARYLKTKNMNVKEIHGDMAQAKRNKVMASMRNGNLDVLIASDLAARGLDIDHISHVINYDLPEDPEVYVHRIGRTARVGRKGIAWAYVSPDQGNLLTEIEKLVGLEIKQMEYPDFKPGPVPDDVAAERARYQPKRENVTIEERLAERVDTGVETNGLSEEELAAMFPGGVVPKSAPKRGLGSKFKSKRRR